MEQRQSSISVNTKALSPPQVIKEEDQLSLPVRSYVPEEAWTYLVYPSTLFMKNRTAGS